MQIDIPNMARVIVERRKKLGLSQEALADSAKISLSTVQRIERGKVQPRAYTLKILKDVLELNDSELDKVVLASHDVDERFMALKRINLYALALVFFPFVNLVIPLIAWKKSSRLTSQDSMAGRILSFQLLWGFCTIAGIFLSIILTNLILGNAGSGHFISGIFYLIAVLFNITMVGKTAFHLTQNRESALAFIPNLF